MNAEVNNLNVVASTSYGSTLEGSSEHGKEYFIPIDDEFPSGSTSTMNSNSSSHSGLSHNSPWLWRNKFTSSRIGAEVELRSSTQTVSIGWNCFRYNVFDILAVKVLGFDSNPCRAMHDDQDPLDKEQRNNSHADMRLSMLSNFSTSYNILSVSLAIHVMSGIYEMDKEDRTVCSSALLAGMIIGQLVGGTLGDAIGRHKAMSLVMFLQIFAACGSAFSTAISYDFLGLSADNCWMSNIYSLRMSIYNVLSVWRFILGLGCGGVYPLAATLTAESSSKQVNRAKLVALTFSMQGIGYCIVPLFAWVLIFILGEQSDLTWRILLGVGALPGIILTFHRSSRRQKIKVDSSNSIFDEEESHDLRSQTIGNHKNEQPSQTSVLDAIRCEKDLFRKLVGTAGCWFIFDVLYYGNTLFQPIVLDAVFGGSETTKKTARDAAIIALLALPGYFISVAVVGYQSPRFIQIQGFLVMTILYAIIGMAFSSLSSNRPLLLLLYGASFFFSDYGPNTTTFMLPSMTFSPACRSTLNGISAASGKLGALLGATMFEPAAKKFGDDTVMMICSALSLIGMLMTLLCVRSDVGLGSSHTGAKQRQQIAVSRKHSAPSLLDF